MSTQAQLCGQQLTFSSFIPTQPAPTEEAIQATEEINSETQRGIMKEIEDKQERISELLKEIGGTEEDKGIIEADELEFEPDRDKEVIYNPDVPRLEEELSYLRAENEQEIASLEEEIGFLEARLK